MVCNLWYSVTQHPSLAKKYSIYVYSKNQMKRLVQSKRFFSNMIFSVPSTNLIYNKFWKINLNNLQYVCLDGINDINLPLKFLLKSKSLKTLELRRINYFFSLGNLEVDQQTCNITKISFGDYLCDNLKLPLRILSVIPKLESLQLKTCKMDVSFLAYLENPNLTSTLKNLNLFFDANTLPSIDVRSSFLRFLKVKHFDLEHFSFTYNTMVFKKSDHKKIVRFFLTQKNLKSLKILTCGEIGLFDELISGLPNLKSIGVMAQSEYDPYLLHCYDCYLIKFDKFWDLDSLEIHLRQYFQYSYPIFESLKRPCDLRKLHIVRVNVKRMVLIGRKMPFLTKLTVLIMTESTITDGLLQLIFENLLELRELRLISRGEDVSLIFFFLLKEFELILIYFTECIKFWNNWICTWYKFWILSITINTPSTSFF